MVLLLQTQKDKDTRPLKKERPHATLAHHTHTWSPSTWHPIPHPAGGITRGCPSRDALAWPPLGLGVAGMRIHAYMRPGGGGGTPALLHAYI